MIQTAQMSENKYEWQKGSSIHNTVNLEKKFKCENDDKRSHNDAMTAEEQQSFLSALRKPEFRALLDEYMQEISDPNNRAETEAYLKQLEAENKVPKDKILITPIPVFVIKTKYSCEEENEPTGKIFINVCMHEKIKAPSSTMETSAGASKGTNWHLPYSIGPERKEKDHCGHPTSTFDVVYHPRTIENSRKQEIFRKMLIDTAIEATRKQYQGCDTGTSNVDKNYRILKGVCYKSGEPIRMCLPKDHSSQFQPPLETPETYSDNEALSGLTTISNTPAKINTSRTRKEMQYELIYRGEHDWMDHMMCYGNAKDLKRPKEIIVKIPFPSRENSNGIILEVSEKEVQIIHSDEFDTLKVDLPFPILKDEGFARFNQSTRELVITLPVQTPQRPIVPFEVREATEDPQEHPDLSGHLYEHVERSAEKSSTSKAKPRTKSVEFDAFIPVRETALMVSNDPIYQKTDTSIGDSEGHSEIDRPLVSNHSVMVEEHANAPLYTTHETATELTIFIHVPLIEADSIRVHRLDKSLRVDFKCKTKSDAQSSDVASASTSEMYQLEFNTQIVPYKIGSWEIDTATENAALVLHKLISHDEDTGTILQAPKIPEQEPLRIELRTSLLYELD
ncbi:unnamed protein product [Albugo candida]|uniref:PIH1 domain-containing protein 1 n=1 Tax=Albugo candida TaxID=65357 RepID=A0A024G2W8_9STRA|nr:unnamed protein product [Albugo candida]|eukprot:CCI40996.1 unnamed protein product [Albugo candida]